MSTQIRSQDDTYRIVTIIVVPVVFALSMMISPYYTDGDQLHYRRVYDEISSFKLFEAYTYYRSSLDSSELVHFLITYFASPILSKDFLVSLFNAALAYAAIQLSRTLGASAFIAALIPLTNYYFFVMYFSAERLKFAMIFLLLGMCCINKYRSFYFYSILAVLSHTQTLIIYASMLLRLFFHNLLHLFKTGRFPIYLLFLPLLVVVILAVNFEQITSKFVAYYQERSWLELSRNLIFMMLALFVSKNKVNTIVLFVPILVATMLVGGDRVNMLGYFLFLYFALQYQRGLNLFSIVTALYFAIKTIVFVTDIITTGTGFPLETIQ